MEKTKTKSKVDEIQELLDQEFYVVANNYKFKTKKKHHIHLNA